jgi:alpha-L-fucosidase
MGTGAAYQATWNSLRQHQTPAWFSEAKFGFYTHWGVYSVPACGPNASWYAYNMYREGTPQYEHHVKHYGAPASFGYKDFIPAFTAAKFDPDEWAELFKQSGARFAGPVGEHHDGFCLWDTRLSQWSAARLGPRRDVVGQLEKAIRRQGMKFLVALHHAENWWFYPHWRREFDTADPRYAGLYGEAHDLDGPGSKSGFFDQSRPSRRFLETWLAKIAEAVELYRPDMLWFDFGLRGIPDWYKQQALAAYYNRSAAEGREVVVTYKTHDLPPNVAVLDLELGREGELTYHEWLTDTTVDDGEGWGYVRDAGYKPVTTLVHYLVDNVSRNGRLLLNVGPQPDGTIPGQAQAVLKGIGQWLAVNDEAIHATTPWAVDGEGPTRLAKAGAFSERQTPQYTARDIRFTSKADVLYAICLAWPGDSAPVLIESLKDLYPREIRSVTLLGHPGELDWRLTAEGLLVTTPPQKPCEHAFAFKITRGRPDL